MKLVCLVSLVLLLSAGTLAAQQGNRMTEERGLPGFRAALTGSRPARVPKTKTTVCQAQDPHCPIAMRAQHVADGEMVKTGSAQPRGIGQWLRLTLIAPDSRRIVKATLTIRGLSPKGRAMQALRNGNNSSDAVTQQIVQLHRRA